MEGRWCHDLYREEDQMPKAAEKPRSTRKKSKRGKRARNSGTTQQMEGRWCHDLYREEDQMPKTTEELRSTQKKSKGKRKRNRHHSGNLSNKWQPQSLTVDRESADECQWIYDLYGGEDRVPQDVKDLLRYYKDTGTKSNGKRKGTRGQGSKSAKVATTGNCFHDHEVKEYVPPCDVNHEVWVRDPKYRGSGERWMLQGGSS